MKLTLKIKLFLIGVALMLSCKQKVKVDDEKIDFKEWSWLVISPEDQKITIFYDSDTAYLESWKLKDTIYRNNSRCTIKTNYKKDNFIIKKADRDSLFSWSLKMIENKSKPKDFCTEYCGHISFSLEASQMYLYKSYTSICNWRKISKETASMYELLSKTIKVHTYSNCLSEDMINN